MIFIFRGDELLVRESGVDLPDGDTCAQVGVRFELMQQIWLTHDPQLRTTHVARDTVAPPGYAFRKLRALLSELGERRRWPAGPSRSPNGCAPIATAASAPPPCNMPGTSCACNAPRAGCTPTPASRRP